MRIIVGVSGASGTVLALSFLRTLRRFPQVETHLVVTHDALRTLALETDTPRAAFLDLANEIHPIEDLAASIASGSFVTAGMVVIPCSMKSLAGIVYGYSDNLLLRAADVCIKEKRKLVLVTREMPFSPIHLENMLKAAQLGAVIIPPVMTFYHRPQSVEDMVQHLVGKILLQFDLTDPNFQAWQGAD